MDTKKTPFRAVLDMFRNLWLFVSCKKQINWKVIRVTTFAAFSIAIVASLLLNHKYLFEPLPKSNKQLDTPLFLS